MIFSVQKVLDEPCNLAAQPFSKPVIWKISYFSIPLIFKGGRLQTFWECTSPNHILEHAIQKFLLNHLDWLNSYWWVMKHLGSSSKNRFAWIFLLCNSTTWQVTGHPNPFSFETTYFIKVIPWLVFDWPVQMSLIKQKKYCN